MAVMAGRAGYHSPQLHPHGNPASNTRLTRAVSAMAQQAPLPRLAQSRSKKDFFLALGWSDRNEVHKRLYALMKDEASSSRTNLSSDRSNLTPEARNDGNIQPPYSASQMTETALYNEVINIWQNAGAETRPIYDRGYYVDNNLPDNWIIRWVLWHVFRYRDPRNGSRPSRERPARQQDSSEGVRSYTASDYYAAYAASQYREHQPYDPVRDALSRSHQ